MKKLIITFLVLFQTFAVMAQADSKTDSVPDKAELDRFYAACNSNEYSRAVTLGNALSEKLINANTRYADSVYSCIQMYIGRCYYRLQKPLEAARAASNGVKVLKKLGLGGSILCSMILDNAGTYYIAAEKCDSGLQYTKEALQVISHYPDKAVTTDMQAILMHIAESYFCKETYQDAIIYEIRALGVIEKLHGRYSEEYIAEMPYLTEYYRRASLDKKVSDNEAELQRIQEEYENGKRDLPDLRDFKSADECHKYNYEANRCANYMLSYGLQDSKNFVHCFKYLLLWTTTSSDIELKIGESVQKTLNSLPSKAYCGAYIAGCTRYALDNDEKKFTPEMYYMAMVDVLNFYINNREFTGEVKFLEDYINVYNKNKDENELHKMIMKNYEKEFPEKEE